MAAGAHRPARVAVAASGGLDSTALLHCTARLAQGQGVEVHALHVHHGLHPQADDWMAQVAAQCRRWGGIAFHGHRVAERPAPGDSIEAWARRVRYRALAEMARQAGCSLVLLAHHRRDQAETVLLQALRGAGPAGLAAMPARVDRDGLTWARPWLDQPRQVLVDYVRRYRLRHVADPSNTDDRYARSRLRTQLWPALLAHSPDAETALAAVARRAHETRLIVDEVAREDMARVADARGLRVAEWQALAEARRANVLRHWLGQQAAGAVPETLVQRLLRELPRAASGCWPLGRLQLRRHADHLLAVDLPSSAAAAPAAAELDLSRPGLHPLPGWGGALQVQAVADGGVPAQALRQARVLARSGGEQFQRHARGLPRGLKKQFQEADVPSWMRDGPLVYAGPALVFVPGLGLDARAQQWPGAPRVQLAWRT